MFIYISKDNKNASKLALPFFTNLVKKKEKPVICFATGSSPIDLYNLIIEDHKNNNTCWANVVSFNLDEYVGADGSEEYSYRYFMNHHLFDHININIKNTHVPNGIGNINQNILDYEKKIHDHNQIDLLLLGLGRNGHIGFCEPGTDISSLTHVVKLHESSRKDHARMFFDNDISKVPTKAITMGIKSIMNAKCIILLAFGESKEDALKKLTQDHISLDCPASILQLHPNVHIFVDEQAAKSINKDNLYLQIFNL
ncbi:glucosamine-6-phosphate deaminase [Mycoplasma sp. SG1]|uniref:glucosamine-6-phosphate deaminase n=1 Tax=Mycoplasma sp. SG1 TaxID=2810348 RepID=UPI002024633F|nr:glucosamine-6-phosphate deaminase [Mycoplasma sp. SG1]URM53013.1 glucosamine-6-phosphate deaminase [Mycoplasma sp. SG1]